MTSTDDVTESKILLAEYDCLKDEQKTRIGFRDNLLYFTLAAATAVVVVTVQSGQSRLLLFVPAICLILGWTYLVNDEKISAIGCYVRDQLGPRLGKLASAHGTVFGWEVYHRNVAGHAMRKRLQTVVDLCAYLVLPIICTTAFWCSPTVQPLLALTSLVQTLALAVLGWQFLRRTERQHQPRRTRSTHAYDASSARRRERAPLYGQQASGSGRGSSSRSRV